MKVFKHFLSTFRRDINSSTFKHLFMFSSTFEGNPWNSSSFQGCANPVFAEKISENLLPGKKRKVNLYTCIIIWNRIKIANYEQRNCVYEKVPKRLKYIFGPLDPLSTALPWAKPGPMMTPALKRNSHHPPRKESWFRQWFHSSVKHRAPVKMCLYFS